MVDILVKDKLRASVEASSGGKQTVLYTAKGQPTYMNILNVFSNDLYGSADGMGSTHPAFFYGGQQFSQLFIGTYKGTVVNGELLSLPYTSLNDGTTSMRNLMEATRACGRGFHLMSYLEYTAVAYQGMASGGKNLGNTNAGQDATGRKGVLSGGTGQMVLTGSGGYTWSHDGTISGIQDIAGGGWEFACGMRIQGDELQIQGNSTSYNYDSASQSFSNDWWAIDATTGGLVAPTSTGTINTSDFRATTANSIRISNTANELGTTAIAMSPWQTNIQANYIFGAGISDFCKSQLKTFGIIPVSSLKTENTAYLQVPNGNYTTTTYFMRSGAPNTGNASGMFASASLVNSDAFTISNNYGRPCYIQI